MNKKKVLLIDDEVYFLELLKDRLSLFDVDVVKTMNGVEALAQIRNNKFDLIITDLKMPKMDGISFLAQLTFGMRDRSTPILVVTGYFDEKNIKKIPKSINFKILLKPVNVDEFNEAVVKLLK